MADEEKVGRLLDSDVGKPHTLDDPTKAYSALLTKVDEMIDLLKALTAKLDADAGVTDTDFASTLTDSLEKLKFRL